MLKILHAADLHLDSAFAGRSEAATARLRQQLRAVPEKIVEICRREDCDLLLLAGDVFDAAPTAETLQLLKKALSDVQIPVFISPGNHDFCTPASPWLTGTWPENVHIFTVPTVESVAVPALDCRIYGAGFTSMDCDALLEDFQIQGEETYQIAVLHGDPVQSGSAYNPVSQAQVANSDLHYLALGHIHKTGSFRAGRTLCAWPGCPMGRGFDETGDRGALVVTLSAIADARFVPLSGPRFHDLTIPCGTDPVAALNRSLPPLGSDDYYRISLTGEAGQINLPLLRQQFTRFPHLQLKDRTQPLLDVWGRADNDSLEGVYFGLLKEALNTAGAEDRETLELAARISRQLLEGREVSLP